MTNNNNIAGEQVQQRAYNDGDQGRNETPNDFDLSVQNNSKLGRMFWIGFYTTLLSIITLTIFRFWGRTHFRRQLWADTKIGGEALEYTGRGKELFIGFVIAIFTFMLPYFAIITIGQAMLEPEIFFVVILLVYIVLFVIIGVAIFLARRYHLSRTRLRGIRFAQGGSAWNYGFASLGYLLLTIVTLGWFGPAARVRLSRKLWENAWFGDQQFSFVDTPETKAEPVYKSFALVWFGGVVLYGLFFAAVMALVAALGGLEDESVLQGMEFIGGIYALALVLGYSLISLKD